jgi:hypothetical protein
MPVIQPERINMKRLLSIIAATSFSMLSLADQVNVATGTTATILVPAVIPASFVSSLTNWVPFGVYTNGTIVKASNYVYTCRTTGTSSNVLASFNGDVTVTDGSVTWAKNDIWDRKVVSIQNTSTNGVLHLIIANGGYRLDPAASIRFDSASVYQGMISATSTVTNVVCNLFWY